ncbi:hypothetical protein DPMN_108260 [Dreissena polymorpha]|uniref:Uncharacterized protein n=1 Tax=Dreissena polymorpha TaxID=45954 RepID=A0A9D4K8R1_DREPO|nr:hypothetical protein DPMN_108260 [Dreissena polymorpha]
MLYLLVLKYFLFSSSESPGISGFGIELVVVIVVVGFDGTPLDQGIIGSCLRCVGLVRTPCDPGILGSCLRRMGLVATPLDPISAFGEVPETEDVVISS